MRPPLLLLFLSAACAAWHSSASRSRWARFGLHVYSVRLRSDSSGGTPRQTCTLAIQLLPAPCGHRPSCARPDQNTSGSRQRPVLNPADPRRPSAQLYWWHSACRYRIQIHPLQDGSSSSSRQSRAHAQTTIVLMVSLLYLLSCCRQPVGCLSPDCHFACQHQRANYNY